MEVKTSNGVTVIIDDSLCNEIDISKIYFDKSNGYVKYKKTYLHRIVTNAKHGEVVDHINRNKVDNRKENLRICSQKINAYNKSIENKNGRGIYFDKYGDRYRACISNFGKTLKLGSFKNIDDAKAAYNKAALDMYGSDAILHELPDAPHFEVA